MLTVHAGLTGDVAVAVRGELIEAVGSRAELAARYPDARVREWAGELRPALVLDSGLPPAPSHRERVHALFRQGGTAVPSAHVPEPALRATAARAGVRLLPPDAEPPALAPDARADLAVFTPDGRCLATVLAGRVVHRRA